MIDGLGLESAYGETLSRIKGQGEEESRLGMAVLMWIYHSERPLEVDELCHALGVEIGSADFDGNNVPSIETLIALASMPLVWVILWRFEGGFFWGGDGVWFIERAVEVCVGIRFLSPLKYYLQLTIPSFPSPVQD